MSIELRGTELCTAVIMTTLIENRTVRIVWSWQQTNHQLTWKEKLVNMHSNLVTSLVLYSHHTDTLRQTGYHPHTYSIWQNAAYDYSEWTQRTGEASSCCFSRSLHSCVVHMSESFSNCGNMERFDLYSVTEPCGPPELITIQVAGRKSMKYVCLSCWCCTESLRNIKQPESYWETNQCSDMDPCLWRQVYSLLHMCI